MNQPVNTNLMRIGTLLGGKDAPRIIPQVIDYGFESFELTFWQTTGGLDLFELAKRVREAIGDRDIVISGLGVFGNVLTGHGDNADALASWERCIDAAPAFGTDLVAGFTGRIVDQPINASIPRFRQVFGELSRRAADNGVRLAFENCDMGGTWERGDWNIAHNPTAWEMMFDAVPADNLAAGPRGFFMFTVKTPPLPGTLYAKKGYTVRTNLSGTELRDLATATGATSSRSCASTNIRARSTSKAFMIRFIATNWNGPAKSAGFTTSRPAAAVILC